MGECGGSHRDGVVALDIPTAGREGRVSASRLDLVIANHAVMTLVQGTGTISEVRDGGHSPVVVDISFCGPTSICWRAPRPRPPNVMLLSSTELLKSWDWTSLLQAWLADPVVSKALEPGSNRSVNTLSSSLATSLTKLVALAGGWQTRPANRRKAYDSTAVRRVRSKIVDLNHVEVLTRPHHAHL
jgi:hypothetical protein